MHNTYSEHKPARKSRLSRIEPRICLSDNCSFPFGPACAECSSAFDAHQMANEDTDPDGRESKEALVQAASFAPDLHPSKRLGPSPSGTSRHTEQDLSSLSSGQTTYISTSTAASGPSPVCTNSSQPEDEAHSRLSMQTSTSTSSLPSNSSSSFESNPLSSSFDAWVSELFSNTLDAQLKGTHFIGGAEDENTTLDFCPICHAPLGDPRDQHLLRCQYAQEEQARIEEFIARCEKRTRE